MDSGFSVADALALTRSNRDGDGFLEGNGIIILILFFLIFGFGGGGYGNRGGNGLTQLELQNGFDTNSILRKLDGITNGICSSSYENAQLINNNTLMTMQGMNTLNQTVNDGFNGVQRDLCAGFNSVNTGITNLGYQLQQCCCDLKTMMLQDKYEAVQTQLQQAQNVIVNNNQTKYILDQLGRYYTYPGCNPLQMYGFTNGNNCGCGCGRTA